MLFQKSNVSSPVFSLPCPEARLVILIPTVTRCYILRLSASASPNCCCCVIAKRAILIYGAAIAVKIFLFRRHRRRNIFSFTFQNEKLEKRFETLQSCDGGRALPHCSTCNLDFDCTMRVRFPHAGCIFERDFVDCTMEF